MSKKELNIFKLLSEKPWEESQKVIDDKHDGKTLTLSREKLGVRTIMVVSTVIFSLFIVSYSDRMLVHDWRSLSEPWLLWINTIILIFTSFVFHKAKVLSDKKITTKWFYNYANTEEFKSKFLITIKSLVALKKMQHTKIGLVGGISPGFDNMKVDQSIIKQNIGLSVEESTIKELVRIAKGFDQKTIDSEVLKIKSVASSISVSNDDSFNRVARIYFALKKMKEEKVIILK